MTMDTSPQILDFIQRFQDIRNRRETSDQLIESIIIYCNQLETTSRHEILQLHQQLQEKTLALIQSTKSQRDLERRCDSLEAQVKDATLYQHGSRLIMDDPFRHSSPATSTQSITGLSPFPPPAVKPVMSTLAPIGTPPSSTPKPSTPAPAPASSPAPRPQPSTSISYAKAISKASPPPTVTLPLPLRQSTPSNTTKASKRTISSKPQSQPTPPILQWTPAPRGLDASLDIKQDVLDSIKRRKENNKLCNNHYLRGPCGKMNGGGCPFEHGYTPTVAEKTAIAFLARMNPCTSGQDCEVDDCIYGHHCPCMNDLNCTHPYCKFKPWEHPPGTKYRATYPWMDQVE